MEEEESMNTMSYQAIQFENSGFKKSEDSLIVETALNIRVNNEIFTVTMQTPGDEHDLVRGLLFSEGITDQTTEVEIEVLEKSPSGIISHINASVPDYDPAQLINKRSLLSASSCGICGSRELEIPKGSSLAGTKKKLNFPLESMYREMAAKQSAFLTTGGCHAAAIFTDTGQFLTLREDVGRHNAVDKAIGDMLHKNELGDAKILLCSGRISYEIVSKAFRARIPVLTAVSAPTSLSVDFAKEFGITLIGFAREGRYTIYAHPERMDIS